MNKKKIIPIVAILVVLLALVAVLCVRCAMTGDTPDPTEPDASTTQPGVTDPTNKETDPTGTETDPTGTETDPTGTETEPTREQGVYFVTILPSANGTVVSDRTEAHEGDTVTLTVTPDEGYELLSLTVNGENSELTFVMPAEDVNVLARFGLTEETPPADSKVYPNGDFFGSAEGFHSSDALNMDTDSGANPYLEMDAYKATPLYAYVKGVTAKQFYLEMTVQVTGIRSDEAYPKFGLITNDGGEMVKFYLDMTTEKQVSTVGAVHQASGKEDDWAGQATWNLNKKLDLSANTVKLGLLRDGNNYYFYVNGQLVAAGSDLSEKNTATGIFSFGTSLKLTNYRLVQSGKDYDALLKTAKSDVEASTSKNFGSSQNTYTTTNGVDLTKDNGSDPSIQFLGDAPQYAYLKDVFTDKFCFETQINVQSVLNSDAYPKFGIMVNGATQMVKFYVDMTPELTATNVGVVYQATGADDDWAGAATCEVPGMSFAGSDTIKLKLVRDGRAYYFYVNDTLVLCDETGFAAEDGAVGIFSFNTVLTASDYKVSTGSTVDSAIQGAKDDAVELNKLGLTCNWFTDKGNGVYTLTTTSAAGHKVDDLTFGGRSMKEAYYSVKGKLTLTEAGDWGQARILISADAQNEYFIALERTDTGKFQIFTMSKKGSNDWGDWKEIVSADVNGSRNSIDFEIIVIGDKLYFLIDDTVVYADNGVSMSESTVKFTGYNMGITTVENLSAQVFETQQDAESYLAGKN